MSKCRASSDGDTFLRRRISPRFMMTGRQLSEPDNTDHWMRTGDSISSEDSLCRQRKRSVAYKKTEKTSFETFSRTLQQVKIVFLNST